MKRFNLFLCLVFFLLVGDIMAATTGKLKGYVADKATGERLPGVQVVVTSIWFGDIEVDVAKKMGAISDADGNYFILNIEPGVYTIVAKLIGYKTVVKQKVAISSGHTTILNFSMEQTAIQGEEVVVVAKKEIIKKDLSSSSIEIKSTELNEVPQVNDIQDYVNLQAGVSGWSIRGGNVRETQFMMDGLLMVDNRANEPIAQPNLSSIEEINILKGGFNAEYGNVRSGIINVVTKKGSRSKYHMTLDIKYSPAHYKHRGPSLFDKDNYYVKPYYDTTDSLCWKGTDILPDSLKDRYPTFEGWISFAEGKPGTPEDYRNIFIWEHRLPGANKLLPPGYDGPEREGHYGDKPDKIIDVGFGGPVPGFKGKLTFYASYRTNRDAFALPTWRDYYSDDNFQLKLTYYINSSMELNIDGLWGKVKTMSASVSGGARNNYLRSGSAILWSSLTEGPGDRSSGSLYLPNALTPYDIDKNVIGFTFTHTLSPSTFYNIRFSMANIENFADSSFYSFRDTTPIVDLDNGLYLDERPYGLTYENLYSIEGTMNMGGIQACQRDYSTVKSYNFKADITSQINTHNEVKTGIEFNYDKNKTEVGSHELYTKSMGWDDKWEGKPIRFAAFAQDKIEFEGMIANVGLRFDYFDPNISWFTETYSNYYTVNGKKKLLTEAPRKKVDSKMKISPRFGISHPISEKSKLYFNYGHFYQLPLTRDLYGIGMGGEIYPLSFLGNPDLDFEKTVAYELGYEHDIRGQYLLHIAGYYKDVSEQAGSVRYVGIDEVVSYYTVRNNNYRDIRGFEITLRKRYGRWITAWINYDYMSTTWGYTGRQTYYQDRRLQATSGRYELTENQSDVQPSIRAQVTFKIPKDLNKYYGGWDFSLLFSWRDGPRFTWDPLHLNTPDVRNNVEWKDYYMFDGKFSKKFKVKNVNFEIYGDINNIFNIKYLAYGSRGFLNGPDFEQYMKSLHLPMYKDPRYSYEGGNDKPGDVRSKDKPYINMPNRYFLTYTNPRSFFFGLRVNF